LSPADFSGATAECYAGFRRGYPDPVVDRLVDVLGLDAGSRVLDLGCGSGQLTLPLARRVGLVIGADPEPDMLRLGRRAGLAAGVDNAVWLLAADTDLGAFETLVGRGTLAAVTIGCAFHWMDCPSLFVRARTLLRGGGLVAVITNGLADWEYRTPWARVLRDRLAAEFGGPVEGRTGTDEESQRAVVAALAAAGFVGLHSTLVEYREERTVEELIGSLYSAMASNQVERLRGSRFESDLTGALAEVAVDGRLAAPVAVRIVSAAVPAGDRQAGAPARPATR
jgi:SAM-dependent methyltransferase